MNISKRRRLLRNKKGFTLIELIVVIAVIAILASVMLPRFTGFTDSARYSAVRTDIRNYATGVSAILAEGKTLSTTAIEDVVGDLGGTITLTPVLSPGDTGTADATDNPSGGDFLYSKRFNNNTITVTGSYDYETGTITVPN